MNPKSEFVAHLSEVFRLFGEVVAKRMFGGYGLFHQGLMWGLIADDVLYLKADAQSVEDFTRRGCRPFTYIKQGKGMNLSYYGAPEEIFDDATEAKKWADKAFSAAIRAKTKKRINRGNVSCNGVASGSP